MVADLVGITPNYVFVAGFDGFADMVDTIGGVRCASPRRSTTPSSTSPSGEGANSFDGTEALDFTRGTVQLGADDFARSANQQQVMRGILRQLLAHEDEEGFIERGTLAALAGLETDLPPTELYRLAQAVTQVEPGRVTTCVLSGDPRRPRTGRASCSPTTRQARRIGADAATTPGSSGGCSSLDSGSLLQPGLAGQDDRLRPVGDLELGEDVARVVAHGLDREPQLRGRSRRSPGPPRSGRG